MNFATTNPGSPGEAHWPDARRLAYSLLACCALTTLATAFPWTRIQLATLWGEVTGPIAARTSVGFTCVTTSLLTALLLLSEGHSAQTREAVRTACVLLMGAAGSLLLLRLWQGPGTLLGGSAVHSWWFYAAVVAVLAGVLFCLLRLQRRPV